ncbi:uncharacterized protein LOC101736719 isoform X3 [Bombyx mori]|nr:uncharacterized protein LOC101736719 isoform X4 [Bombyx mori]
MTVLDQLPDVDSFFGVDLKTGSMVVASIGIIHPTSFGCTFFLPLSYLLVTIWIMVALFFAASVVLFCGVYKDDSFLCTIWIWYAVVFAVVMLIMMVLLALVFTSRKQRTRVLVAITGMLWYI